MYWNLSLSLTHISLPTIWSKVLKLVTFFNPYIFTNNLKQSIETCHFLQPIYFYRQFEAKYWNLSLFSTNIFSQCFFRSLNTKRNSRFHPRPLKSIWQKEFLKLMHWDKSAKMAIWQKIATLPLLNFCPCASI